jgi:hypothetical protein
VNTATGALSALRRLSIAIAIAIVFLFGLATTVYLSLRSPEVSVPEVVGKDRFEAEQVLTDAGLKFRVRATRPSNQLKADTVLFQVPRPGEVVKAGQTVAMDISRTVKAGEASEAVVVPEKKAEERTDNLNSNDSGNENKPKRKPANKNDNANANPNANGNRNANSSRPAVKRDANANSNEGNSNRPAVINNNNKGTVNQNQSGPPVPRPSPASRPSPENP